ncbi:MAG: diguanylate cyclase [Verrucomicrobiota bacterium]
MDELADRDTEVAADLLAAEVAQLRSVVAIQHEVSTSLSDLPTLMTLVATRAQQLTGASGAMIELPEQDDLVCRAATGSAQSVLGVRVGIDDGISGLSFQTGRVLHCDDAREDPRADRLMSERVGLRSAIVVPLDSSQTRFGVLTVMSLQPGAFTTEHQELVRLLGGIMATRLDLAEQLQARQLLLTEKTIAITTLRESEAKFRNAFDDSGIGMALVASDGRWLKVNRALCRTLGYTQPELLGRDFRSLTHADDLEVDRASLDRMLAGEIATYEIEKRCLHKDGAIVWILLTVSSVKDTEGQPLYFIAQIQDITARKQAEDALTRLAIRDDLTGLYNRREMNRLLHDEMARAHRHRRPLSLVLLDVDLFKLVNDTHGHPAGDTALLQIAKVINDSVRVFDRVARYGGEEFAVILPETSAPDAFVVAERIRARVAGHPFEITSDKGETLRIGLTVSLGVTTMSEGHEMSPDHVIREADRGLYAAKQMGRNRCVATPPSREAGCAG